MYPPIFDLTPLTGRKSNENRTTVVANVEMKPRTKWVTLISFVASIPVTAIFMAIFGIYAIFVTVLIMAASHVFFNVRTSTGLNQRHYEAILDKKRSGDNVFYLCGSPVEVGQSAFGVVRRTVAPVKTSSPEEQNQP